VSQGNLTITVARKPVTGTVASNALQWGTGGLNIDATRIGTEAVSTHGYPDQYDKWSALKGKDTDKGDPIYHEHSGRWPANLILVHNVGCKRLGTKRVPGQNPKYVTEGKGATRHLSFGLMGGRPAGQGIGFADEDGLETIDAWECEPTCPCRVLDEQSRNRRSAGDYPSSSREEGNRVVFHGLNYQGTLYTDGGGAARFFKQVKADE